jgi:ABC-2 type transport system permease protein
MVWTLTQLTLWQLKNRIRVRLARLREPRYLIGTIFGIAYITYFAILRNPAFRRGPGGAVAAAGMARVTGPMELIGAFFLLVLAALVWILPTSGNPIKFSSSEVQFLFPAPITRRQLLQYRLLRAQLGLLFGSVMATLFMRPTSFAESWKFTTGLWLILMTSRIYFTGVSLYREGLRQRGIAGFARWAPAVLASGAVLFIVGAISMDMSGSSGLAAFRDVFASITRITDSGPVSWILWPFRTMTRLPLAATTAAYFSALPLALGLLVINYLWVLQADTAFEESAALIAEKAGNRPRRQVQPRVRAVATTPFKLAPTGRLEPAIVWKNLIMVGRYASLRTVLPLVPAMISLSVVASLAGRRGGFAPVVAVACFVLLALTTLLGPMLARNDLRRDLGNLAMLKAWPMSGTTLLRGEILAPGVLLSVMAWLWILGAASFVGNLRMSGAAELILNRLSYMAAAMMVAPAIILAELTVLNGMAVMFPAWISTGATRSRGVDALGQRLFTMAGVLITLIVALLPAALVAGVVAAVVYFTTGIFLIVIPAAIVAASLVLECLVVVELLGGVVDRMDVASVSPSE